MKIARADLLRAENNTISIDESIRFEPEAFARMHNIRSVPDVHVSGEIHYDVVSERAYADLSITGVMITFLSLAHTIMLCSYLFRSKERSLWQQIAANFSMIFGETRTACITYSPTKFRRKARKRRAICGLA